MNRIDKLLSTLLGISALLVVIILFLKISHYIQNDSLIYYGILLTLLLSLIQNLRLKKIIKKYETEEGGDS